MAANQYKPLQPPYTFYLATANTAEPTFAYTGNAPNLILTDPAADWVKLGGTALTDDGEIAADQIAFKIGRTFEKQPPPLNDVYSRRSYLTEVEITVGYKFRDFNVDGVAKLLGNKAVSTVAAAAAKHGTAKMDMDIGVDIGLTALLVRGWGTTEAGVRLPRQWWFPLVFNRANIEFMLGKTWSEFPVEWEVQKNAAGKVGSMLWANAPGT